MSAAKKFETSVSVSGAVNPSLNAAMLKTQQYLKTLAKELGNANLAAHKMPGEFEKVTSEMRKTNDVAKAVGNSIKRISEIAAGVSIGDLFVDGLERSLDLIKDMSREMIELGKYASQAASKFELQSRGVGNLLRDQGFADSLMNQLQNMANASPFQLTDLANTAKNLAARGVGKNQLLGTTGEIGDIVAALGGGAPEMERATLAYGEARSGKTLNTREVNQLTELGVPVWAELQKFTGKSVEAIHKLIEKHQIDSTILDKIFKDLTTGDGLFADGMKKFADTFQGSITTFEDKASQASRDIGFLINDWTGDILKQINNSGAWNKVHNWFEEVRKMSDSVRSFISTMPTSQLLGAFGPAMKDMQDMFGGFNKWLNTFFTEVRDPVNGIHKVLNETGSEEIQKVFTRIRQFFDGIAQVADSVTKAWMFLDAKERQVEQWLKEHNLLNAFGLGSGKNMSVTPEDAVRNAQERFNAAILSGDDAAMQKAKQDLLAAEAAKKSADAQDKLKDATKALTASFAAMQFQIDKATGKGGTGGMLHGDSTGSTSNFTEYGPKVDPLHSRYYDKDSYNGIGHIDGIRYDLSTGDVAMKDSYARGHYHIKPGGWYKSDKDGKMHRWMDTTGSRNPENEDVFKGASINVTNNYTVVGDADHILRTIKEKHHEVARHVHDAIRDQFARNAVV